MASSVSWDRVSSKVLGDVGGNESLEVVGYHAGPFVALHHPQHSHGRAGNGQNQTENLVNQQCNDAPQNNYYRESVLQAI